MNEMNIAKMMDKIKELPEEMQRSFCWVIKHIEIVDELVQGEKLSQKEMKELIQNALEREDYIMILILLYKESYDKEQI